MIVQPMSSLSGYVTYLRYTAGIDKGGVVAGDTFNGVYGMGHMDADRMRYSSSAVSEIHELTEAEATKKTFGLDWYPVVKVVDIRSVNNNNALVPADQYTVDNEGKVTFAEAMEITAGMKFKIRYFYDNESIPQTVTPNSLPTLTARMQAVNLHAHARRIAVYYNDLIVA